MKIGELSCGYLSLFLFFFFPMSPSARKVLGAAWAFSPLFFFFSPPLSAASRKWTEEECRTHLFRAFFPLLFSPTFPPFFFRAFIPQITSPPRGSDRGGGGGGGSISFFFFFSCFPFLAWLAVAAVKRGGCNVALLPFFLFSSSLFPPCDFGLHRQVMIKIGCSRRRRDLPPFSFAPPPPV